MMPIFSICYWSSILALSCAHLANTLLDVTSSSTVTHCDRAKTGTVFSPSQSSISPEDKVFGPGTGLKCEHTHRFMNRKYSSGSINRKRRKEGRVDGSICMTSACPSIKKTIRPISPALRTAQKHSTMIANKTHLYARCSVQEHNISDVRSC